MTNPLIAPTQNSTQSFSGVQILESVNDTKSAIESGGWASEVLGVGGTALAAIDMAMDPLGAVLSAGVGWLMEHVGPVKHALDSLTGNAEEIKAHAETWQNVAKELGAITSDMAGLVTSDTAHWVGAAGDAYRTRSRDIANLLTAAQSAAEGASHGITTAGEVVGSVRTLVRDIIAELVGHLISWALQVLCTLGIALIWVVPKVIAEVAKVAAKIAELTSKLIQAMKKLMPLVHKLQGSLGDTSKALKDIKGSKSGSAGTTASAASSSAKPAKLNAISTRSESKGKSGGGILGGILGRIGDRTRSAAIPPKIRPCTKDPIDLATGDVLLTQVDVELPGVLALVLSRTHLSSYVEGQSFGPSWASTLDQRLEVTAGDAVFAGADGVLLVYPALAHDEQAVFAVEGPRWPLRLRDNDLVVEDVDTGQLLHFPRPDQLGAHAVVSRLAGITDRSGNRIEVDRDADGVPLAVRHSGGYHVEVSTTEKRISGFSLRRNGSAGAEAVEEPISLARFGYDERGNLAEVVNASGLPLRFAYDAAGRLTEWVDRNGMWYRYRYDDAGRCVAAEGADGWLTATISYDSENVVTTETNSLGHTTRHHFNSALQPVKTVDPLGGETTAEFDRYDRVLARTDQLGRTTRFEYTEAGDLARVTRPDGSQIVAEYDANHRPVTVVEPDGAVWRRAYDPAGNLLAVIDPAGAIVSYTYNERGHLIAEVDPLGARTSIECDAAGQPVRITDPLGARSSYHRDAFGRVTAITEADGSVTRLAWTVDGQLRERIGPDGATERWTYDGEGNRVSYVDPLGQITSTQYAGFDLPVAEVDPTGARTELTYDTESQLISMTVPGSLTWRFAYDARGNLVSETDVNGRTTTYTRDAAGQTIAAINSVGQTTRIVRDVLGRSTEVRGDDGATFYTFDQADRVVRATNGDADLELRRDVVGRVVAEICNGRTLTSGFDAAGRRTRRVTPTGVVADFHYDQAGRLRGLQTAGHNLIFGYDAAGRETTRQFGAVTLTQTWTAGHLLHTQTLSAAMPAAAGNAQPGPLQRRAYTYRPDGALVGVLDHLTGVRRYELDPLGRATSVEGPHTSERYNYDVAGNVASASWPSPAALGQPISRETPAAQGERAYAGTMIRAAGRVRYEHDAQGRLIARHARSLSGDTRTWRYVWNSDNRLVAVVTPDSVQWRYLYDALGRRIAKIRLAANGIVSERIDFVWDGLQLAEQTHSNGHTVTWSYKPDGVTPLCQAERVPGSSRQPGPTSSLHGAPQEWIDQRFYGIVADLVGAPTELVDAGGGFAWVGFATLWGESLLAGAQQTACPLRFPGQYHDAETGENYNLHRYYSPAAAGYTAPDPLGVIGGANPHGYVSNPTGWVDPLGLTPCQISQDLAGWKPRQFQFDKTQLVLDRAGLKHILTRHHKEYWDGSVKAQQSFFTSEKATVPQIEHAISEVLKQNRDTIVRRGTSGMYQVRGTVNGKEYVVGMNGNLIGQFYPA